MQESSIGGGGELHQKFVSARHRFWYGLSPSAEFQNDRIPGGVTIVDDHVILNVVAVVPYFQLPRAGRSIECGLAPDGDQLPLGLSHDNKSVFSRRDFVLTHRIVAGEISGVDPGEIGRLEAAALSITVTEYAGTIGARY